MFELWNNEQTFYFTLYLMVFFFYEWLHTTDTLCPFSSLQSLRKDMYWATVNYNNYNYFLIQNHNYNYFLIQNLNYNYNYSKIL